jgi:methionyl-tRNA formyltransferase
MRIVFLGSTRFGLRCLRQIAETRDCEVAGVLTIPQHFHISYRPSGVHNVLHADLLSYAKSHGLPCALMEGKMSDAAVVAQIRAWRPDLMIAVGWYHKLPRQVLDIAPAAGMHASLLPDYSGGAPLVWAMINGEACTGITFFLLDEGVDSGPIIGQARTDIFDGDTIATLYERIEDLGLELLAKHLPEIAQGNALYFPQDELRRRIYPQRTPEDGQIDWTCAAETVRNFIRAQTRPYPGAFTHWKGKKLTVWACRRVDSTKWQAGTAGNVLRLEPQFDNVIAICGDAAALELTQVAYADKEMSGREFKREIQRCP